MGPNSWFVCSLIFWIVGFPVYLMTRRKYVAIRARRVLHLRNAHSTFVLNGKGFCRNCGTSLVQLTNFCPACGALLTS
jgi:hypothetical protein